MGMMDWFRSLAGGQPAVAETPSASAAEAESAEIGGLNFKTAIDAHMKWKTRLEDYIKGQSKEELKIEVVSCDDQCPLGKWIYGMGGESYGTLQSFGDMKAMHAFFHKSAGEVLATAQSGRKEEALGMLDRSEYVRASERVKMHLARLYVEIVARGK